MTQAPSAARTAPSPGSERVVVAAQQLTKTFRDFWLRGRVRAVDSIDFHVERGEVFGLLGPNGSGKSTTIKLILGLLKRSGGRLQVFGRSPFDVSIKKRIGYLPEESYLYPFLNARETLDYYAKLFRLERKTRQRRIDELLDMVGLAPVQFRQIREYSKGMQRRIGLAQALINDPELLILDEPTTGLDPLGTRQVKDLITTLGARGKTILLSSHLLSDVEDCVDRMVILYGGKIRAEGTCDELLVSRSRSVIETDTLDDQTVDEIRGLLERRHKTIERVSAPRQRLEDLFIDIVERARAERVETSGALNTGGAAAAFLRGEQDEAGEGLIERLTTHEPGHAEHAAPEPAPERPAEPEPSIVDELVGRDAATEPPPAGPGPARPDREDRPDEAGAVDDSVISSLLGDRKDDDDDEDRRP
jgi:ABC-2 type transport system ATP-binding protein